MWIMMKIHSSRKVHWVQVGGRLWDKPTRPVPSFSEVLTLTGAPTIFGITAVDRTRGGIGFRAGSGHVQRPLLRHQRYLRRHGWVEHPAGRALGWFGAFKWRKCWVNAQFLWRVVSMGNIVRGIFSSWTNYELLKSLKMKDHGTTQPAWPPKKGYWI